MGKEKNTKPFHDFFSKRENIFLIFIGLIPIFSPSLFERLFNEYITKPIFENIESNIFVDILVILIGVGIFTHYSNKLKVGYIFNTFKTFVILILGCWYLYYRFKGGWHYLSFSICQTFFYTDIFLGIIPLAYIFTKLVKEKEPKKDKDDSQIPEANYDGFLIDEPTKEDSLGRNDYAKAIATKIKKSYPIKYAMAIGITGKWGSGKTSFMGLIEKALIQEEKPIIINFKPRKNHDSNNIIIDFFDELEESLGLYNENLSFNIHQYLKQLTTVDDNIYFKTIDFLNTIILGNKSTQDMFDEINEAIQQIDRQVIILIDDIDRLDSKEVIEVIKLIRFSANFNNFVFVVAYDKGYVINAINEFNTYEKEWFLEKIFQVEFPLPTFETNTLKKKLEEKLISNFPEYETEFKKYFNDNSNQLIIDRCIITMRDVVRFTNAFCLDFDSVKGEVLVKDFINISLLKLKYSTVYEILFEEQNDLFLHIKQSELDEKYTLSEPDLQNFISVDSKKMKNYLLKSNGRLSFSRSKIDDIIKIVTIIFSQPQKKETVSSINQSERYNSDNILSIRKPSNFGIYFSIRLLNGNLSEIDFRNTRKESYDKLILKIDEWLKKGLRNELLNKIEAITHFDDKNDFEKIIKSLFFLGSEYDILEVNQIIQIKSMDSGNRTESNAKLYYNNNTNEYKKFLIQTFENKDYSIPFKANLLQSIHIEERYNHKKANLKFVLEEDERITLLLSYFHIYFDSHHPIKEIMRLNAFCIINDKIPKEISALMLKSLHKENRVFEMLDYCMPKENGEFVFNTFHTNYRHLGYLFESVDDLKEFINHINYNAENPSIKEYTQYLEKNFNEIINIK